MTTRLMNSAMMPEEGTFTLRRVSEPEFMGLVKASHKSRTLVSTIGYQENQRAIWKATGITVRLSREPTMIKDGDTLLCMRVKYSDTKEQRDKSHRNGDRTWEFFVCEYRAPDNASR
jgi:hypothetical protein